MKQQFFINHALNPNRTSSSYTALLSEIGWQGTETRTRAIITAPGTLRNLIINLTAAPGAGKSYVFTLMKNGIASAVTITIADAATTGRDDTHDLAVVAGDEISIRSTPSGTPATTYPRITFEFESTNVGESIHGGAGISVNSNGYISILNGIALNAVRNTVDNLFSVDGSLKNLYLRCATAPGAGKSLTACIVKNGVDQDGAGGTPDTRVVIADAGVSGNATFDLSISAGDLACIKLTLSGVFSTYIGTGCKFTATSDGESNISFNYYGTLENNFNRYFRNLAQSSTLPSGTEQLHYGGITTCKLGKMRASFNVAPGVGKQWDIYLMKNGGSAGDPHITVSGAATTGSDLVNEIEVADLDYISLLMDPTGTPDVSVDGFQVGAKQFYSSATQPKFSASLDGLSLS